MKLQNVEDGPVAPITAPAIHTNCLPSVTRKKTVEAERFHRRYRGITADDACQPADVPSDVVNDHDDIFVQGTPWKGDSGSSFTTDDRSAISTALARLSKTAPTSGSFPPAL